MNCSNLSSDKLLRIGEAAEIIGVSKQTLRNWEKEGDISPEYTDGGHRRYRLSQIKEYQLPETVDNSEIECDEEQREVTKFEHSGVLIGDGLNVQNIGQDRLKPLKSEMKVLDLMVSEYEEDQGLILIFLGMILALSIRLMELLNAPSALVNSAYQTQQYYLDFSTEITKENEKNTHRTDVTTQEDNDQTENDYQDYQDYQNPNFEDEKVTEGDSPKKVSSKKSKKSKNKTIWTKTKEKAGDVALQLNRASVDKTLPKSERERAKKIMTAINAPFTLLTNLIKYNPKGSHQYDVAYLLLFKKPEDYNINRKRWSIRLLSWVCENILGTEAASKSQVGRLLSSIGWNCAIKPKMMSPDPNYGKILKRIGLLFTKLEEGDRILYGDEFLYSTVKVAEYLKDEYAPKGANSILPWSQSKKYYKSEESILVNGLVDITINQLVTDELGTKSYVTYKKSLDRLLEEFYDETLEGTIYIVLDNARYHSPRRLNRRLREKYNNKIIPVFLPTYSPNQNPIERIWQYLLRNSARCGETREELLAELSKAVKSYTSREETRTLSLHCEVCGHKWGFTADNRAENARTIKSHLCFNIEGLSPYMIHVLKHSMEDLTPYIKEIYTPLVP